MSPCALWAFEILSLVACISSDFADDLTLTLSSSDECAGTDNHDCALNALQVQAGFRLTQSHSKAHEARVLEDAAQEIFRSAVATFETGPLFSSRRDVEKEESPDFLSVEASYKSLGNLRASAPNNENACPVPANWAHSTLLAGKLPYVTPGSQTTTPPGYRLVKAFYLSRHCSRYPTATSLGRTYDALNTAFKLAKNETMTKWIQRRYTEWVDGGLVERCSSCGKAEVKAQGQRFVRQGDNRPLNVTWASSYKLRTQTTGIMWGEGVSDKSATTFNPPAIKDSAVDKRACEPSQIFQFSVLRWYNTCGAYLDKGVKNDTKQAQKKYERPMNDALISIGKRIFEAIGGTNAQDDALYVNVSTQVYAMCQADIDVGEDVTEFCPLLEMADLKILADLQNHDHCLTYGPCRIVDDIVTKAPCGLLGQLSKWVDAGGTYSADHIPVTAFFAHAETIAPFLVALKVQGFAEASTYQAPRLAANVRFDVLSKDGGNFVTAWLNEEQIPLSSFAKGCPVSSEPCAIEKVKDGLKTVNTCFDFAGLEKLCDVVKCADPAKR